ncbi:hypothetical protein EPN28_02555 [Patescibacteria group bacterium]|nr:MAG: hypothetical protein EPN28_02555 [Patescibacteria group bacterium]
MSELKPPSTEELAKMQELAETLRKTVEEERQKPPQRYRKFSLAEKNAQSEEDKKTGVEDFFSNPALKISETSDNDPDADKILSSLSLLPESFQVLWDKMGGSSPVNAGSSERKQIEFLEFIDEIKDSHFLSLFQHFLDSNTWSLQEYAQKITSFSQNRAITLTTKEAEQATIFQTTNEDQTFQTKSKKEQQEIIDQAKTEAQEAAELGMEMLLIAADKKAQGMVEKVISNQINIDTKEGKEEFIKQWQEQCPNTPMPAVPGKSWGWNYLSWLKNNKVVSNLEPEADQVDEPQPIKPRFHRHQTLWVDKWQEEDYNAPQAQASHTSTLVKQFFPERNSDRVVEINREAIDQALWEIPMRWGGQPPRRIKSKDHEEFLRQHGFNPDEYELRLIIHDEYARGAGVKNWGQKNFWTHFDHYFLGDDGERDGLSGGRRDSGGPSHVDAYWRDDTDGYLGVRLVLSRIQK